jgi:hypothetical protein
MKNTIKTGFVKGHDFSHADNVNRIDRALAPRDGSLQTDPPSQIGVNARHNANKSGTKPQPIAS